MSPQPYGATTPEQRDQAAEDRDEAAWQRDQASAARDSNADQRDRRAEARTQAATDYARLTRALHGTARQPHSQPAPADQRDSQKLRRHLEEALRGADLDRQAAARDRKAAAADRQQAAQDRIIKAQHRGQAAIERAQHPPGTAPGSHDRWAELYARAQSARNGALAGPAQPPRPDTPPARELLSQAELARLRARLGTMPVIEQAKGIIMAQTGCSDAQAFGYLRQASQRRNEPVRDLAARIAANPTGSNPAPQQPPS